VVGKNIYISMGHEVKTWTTLAGVEACVTRKKNDRVWMLWVAVPEKLSGCSIDDILRLGLMIDDVVEYGPPDIPVKGVTKRRNGVWARVNMGPIHGNYAHAHGERLAKSIMML
jgi:hypothetical protein